MRISDWSSDVCSSDLAMVAINPSKVNSAFTEDDLHAAVDAIRKETGQLLEVVNYNIVNLQYVCAGSRTALKCLIETWEESRVGKECVSTSRYRWSQYH